MGLFDRFSTNLERLKTNKDIKGLKKIFLDIKKPPDDRKTALNYLQELGYTPDNLKEKIYSAVLNGEIEKLNSDDESILVLASFLDSSDFDHCHPNPIHDEYKLKIISKILESRSTIGNKFAYEMLRQGRLWAFFEESLYCLTLGKDQPGYSEKYYDYEKWTLNECNKYFSVPQNKIENYTLLIQKLNSMRGLSYDPRYIHINAKNIILEVFPVGIKAGSIDYELLDYLMCDIGSAKHFDNREIPANYPGEFLEYHWKNIEQSGFQITITTLDDTSEDLSLKHTFNAWIFLGIGKYEEALNHCEIALSLNKNNPYAWHNKGIALYKKNQLEEAKKCLDAASFLDKNYLKSRFKPINLVADGEKIIKAINNS